MQIKIWLLLFLLMFVERVLDITFLFQMKINKVNSQQCVERSLCHMMVLCLLTMLANFSDSDDVYIPTLSDVKKSN